MSATTATDTVLLEAALIYARRGWRVLPVHTPRGRGCSCGKAACTVQGKHPRITGWQRAATTDEAQIRGWWQRWADANVGIACGPESGIFVVDADGDAGLQTLDSWQLEYGLLSPTVMVKTGGGGLQVYFAYPAGATIRNSVKKIAPGIDIRGEGGFIIAPPSLHRSGNRYGWFDEVATVAPAPPWLLERIAVAERANDDLFIVTGYGDDGGPIPEGRRNDALFSIAGRMRWAGLTVEEIVEALRRVNRERCKPPLPEDEVKAIAQGIGRYAAGDGAEDVGERTGRNGSTPHADAGEQEDARGARQDAAWPVLDDAALYGLAGDIVRAIEPHTEGDPVAILLNTLTMFGSAVGPSPHARVGATRHRANEFVVHVGETARARKGTAHNEAERILTGADRDWKPRIMGGLSSGEGLIFAVRDPSYKLDKNGDPVLADGGVEDKRLLAVEPEFSSVLRVAGREGNTLSEQLRRAWDGNDLRTLTKNSPLCATAPHISLLGHITKPELLRELSEMYQANGFANRFLFNCVRRSKYLPHGGMLPDFALLGLADKVRRALDAARRRAAVHRDAEANEVWEAVYPALTADRPGIFGAITARAEAHVLRLSLIYALLDGGEAIRLPHLEAALAVWQYAEDSAKFIFGDATGDPIADRVLSALRTNGPMTQNEIVDLFGRNVSAARLSAALETLVQVGKIRSVREETGGRPRTTWEAMP